MKISVIMVDGEFRENTYGAEYFSNQDFPVDDFEVIWVEYYNIVPEHVLNQRKVKVVRLENLKAREYHSSYCFNAGIKEAKGELIVIPDADQIVEPDFLSELWKLHEKNENLVVYPYRYDEEETNKLNNVTFQELESKCVLRNPLNYGGCLSVRKKWLLKINGYEQHDFFSSGFHANGLDVYTRFKNLGLAIMWAPHIKMYHPWHPFTLADASQYEVQKKVINWRFKKLQYLAFNGIDGHKNADSTEIECIVNSEQNKSGRFSEKPSLIKRIVGKIK